MRGVRCGAGETVGDRGKEELLGAPAASSVISSAMSVSSSTISVVVSSSISCTIVVVSKISYKNHKAFSEWTEDMRPIH